MQLSGKKILVTGADGFIGSHLVETLVRAGCDVRAFIYYNSLGTWGWLDDPAEDVRGRFEVFLGEVTVDPFKEPMRAWLGPTADRLLELYRARHRDHSDVRAWVDLIGDVVFRIPAIRLAEAQASRGAPVYMYRFDWKSPTFGGRLGAAHALELAFVWNRLDLPMAPILLGSDPSVAQPLATVVHATWAQFIKTGDPNGAGLPDWPRYDTERRATMLIDRTSKVVEIRGRGLLIGIEIAASAGTARRYCEALLERGVLAKDTHEQVIRLAPPLIVERAELDWLVEQLRAVLR